MAALRATKTNSQNTTSLALCVSLHPQMALPVLCGLFGPAITLLTHSLTVAILNYCQYKDTFISEVKVENCNFCHTLFHTAILSKKTVTNTFTMFFSQVSQNPGL